MQNNYSWKSESSGWCRQCRTRCRTNPVLVEQVSRTSGSSGEKLTMLRVGRVACRATGLLFDRLPFFQKVKGPVKERTKEKGRGEWKEREKMGYRGGPGGGGRGECERVCAGMGIGGGSESGSEESSGRGHRKTGCQSARTLDIGEHT